MIQFFYIIYLLPFLVGWIEPPTRKASVINILLLVLQTILIASFGLFFFASSLLISIFLWICLFIKRSMISEGRLDIEQIYMPAVASQNSVYNSTTFLINDH